MFGVISTVPGLILGGGDKPQTPNGRPVLLGLTGRVPVKIDPNSKAIKAGDFISPSDLAGHGKKSDKPGHYIGKALESWNPESGKKTINVFLNLGYYGFALNLDEKGTVQESSQAIAQAPTPTNTPTVTPTPEAEVSEREALEKELETIEQDQEVVDALLADSKSLLTNLDNDLDINSLGITALTAANVSVTESLSFGDLTITPEGIASVDQPLRIQPQASQPLEIMAGLVRIDTSGNVAIEGNLDVAGTITTNKLVLSTTDQKPQAESEEPTESESIPSSSIGTATLTAGETSITIQTTALTENSLVYLTPTSSTGNKVLYLKQTTTCIEDNAPTCTPAFTAGIDKTHDTDITFNWWLVDTVSSENNTKTVQE